MGFVPSTMPIAVPLVSHVLKWAKGLEIMLIASIENYKKYNKLNQQ